MTTQEIAQHINDIKEQMTICNNVMFSIMQAANVQAPDQLSGVSAQAWQEQYSARIRLEDYLLRIDAILSNADAYIKKTLKK